MSFTLQKLINHLSLEQGYKIGDNNPLNTIVKGVYYLNFFHCSFTAKACDTRFSGNGR